MKKGKKTISEIRNENLNIPREINNLIPWIVTIRENNKWSEWGIQFYPASQASNRLLPDGTMLIDKLFI